jgi:MFS family permease
MSARYFYGWNVVGATFTMALFSFGLGFYGLTVYLATLQELHGWSASAVSAPVTVYYVAGALLTAAIGDVYERLGPRAVVAGGAVAMAAGVAALGVVTQPWQLYPVFLVMSVGWGSGMVLLGRGRGRSTAQAALR